VKPNDTIDTAFQREKWVLFILKFCINKFKTRPLDTLVGLCIKERRGKDNLYRIEKRRRRNEVKKK